MKKRYLISTVVLLAAFGGAPYLYGTLIENKFKKTVLLINKSDNISLTTEEYKRGWLQSHAKTMLTLRLPQGHVGEAHMTLEHVIKHGPLFKTKTKTGSSLQFAQGLIESKLVDIDKAFIAKTDLQHTDFIKANTLITMMGESKVTLDSEKFSIKDMGPISLDWKGLNGHFEMNRHLNTVNGEILSPGWNFKNKDIDLVLENLFVKTERFLGAAPFEDLWFGKTTGSVHHLTFKNTKVKPFNLDLSALSVSGTLESESDYLRVLGTVGVEKFNLNEQNNGPLNYSIQVNKLSPTGLRLVKDLNQKTKENQAMGGLVFIQKMGELATLFLTPRPELTISSFQLTTEKGLINGELNVAVGGESANNLQSPQMILNSMSGKAVLSLPKLIFKDILIGYVTPPNSTTTSESPEMLQKADQAIVELLQNGMLQEENEQYKLNFDLKGTQLTVNGKPFVLPAVLQTASQAIMTPTS